MPLITFLTDFGLVDPYVGQVKGAILAIAPHSPIVDLTHAVAAQDVFGGAFALWSAVDVFDPGTIHLAVVDPGVGSQRRAIAVQATRGDVFVAPDNGLVMPAVTRLGGIQQAVELLHPAYWRPRVSTTFHGRDLFGPVAAHLAAGVALTALGPPIADPVALELPTPNGPRGEIVHVDTYGNLITNFPADAVRGLERYTVRLLPPAPAGAVNVPNAASYQDVGPGALLAVVGSAGLLEVSARDGSAAALIGAARGTPVELDLG